MSQRTDEASSTRSSSRRLLELPAFKALRGRQFRNFYLGSLVSQLGFWFSHISFQDLMADLTEDELWLAGLFMATFGPVLVVGPVGGVLVDRFDRQRMLMVCYVFVVVVALGQVALVASDWVTPVWLLISGAFIGTGMAVLGPAIQAVTANVVPPNHLPSAISLQAMSANLSRIVGPAIAAPLIAADMFELTWSLYAVGAVVGLMVVSRLTLRPYERDTDPMPIRRRFASGLRHAKERTPALRCLTLVAVVTMLVVSHIALMPTYTSEQLGRPTGDFVWLGVATGIGALGGALTAGSLRTGATFRRGALLALPYCVLLVVFSLVENFWAALAIQLVMGFFYISAFTTMQVIVQQVVGEEFRGRVMSLFQISWAGLVPVGSLLVGLMAGDAGLGLGSAETIRWTGVAAVVWVLAALARDAKSVSELPAPSDAQPR